MLRTILDSLTELKSDLLSCNSRISDLESNFARECVTNCQQDMTDVERDEDTLSVLAENEHEPLDLIAQNEMAIKQPNLATKAIKLGY